MAIIGSTGIGSVGISPAAMSRRLTLPSRQIVSKSDDDDDDDSSSKRTRRQSIGIYNDYVSQVESLGDLFNKYWLVMLPLFGLMVGGVILGIKQENKERQAFLDKQKEREDEMKADRERHEKEMQESKERHEREMQEIRNRTPYLLETRRRIEFPHIIL